MNFVTEDLYHDTKSQLYRVQLSPLSMFPFLASCSQPT